MTRTALRANVIAMVTSRVGRTYSLIALLICTAIVVGGLISSRPSAAEPTAEKPTIVLVHGAWADTSSWNGEIQILQAQGYTVRAIANPLENLTTDSTYVADFLRTIDGPIVLVGHSYGGSVITNAAETIPNVKALVYVDAAAPDVGETNGSLSGADSVLKHKSDDELFDKLPYPGAPRGAVDLYLKRDVFLQNFGNDLPADVATRLWATQRAASTEPPSIPRLAMRRGKRSPPGTSSAAVTRSSRRHRNTRWRHVLTRPSPSSTAGRTSPSSLIPMR